MRTQRFSAVLVVGAALVAAACGSSVTVLVTTESADGPESRANIPVEFLPFDRDSVFDALDAQASSPRPQMSEELRAEAEAVDVLQAEWRASDMDWANERDALQQLSTQLQNMDSRDPAYRRLFEQFDQGETRVNRLDREKKDLFDRFTAAQEAVAEARNAFKIVDDLWQDEAYAGYFDIQMGLVGSDEVLADTTNADGLATIKLPGGDWWATARANTADGEVYWNVPVGDQESVTLNDSNGTVRERL